MMSLTQLFCDVDDFCETFIPQWEASQIESGEKKRRRKRCISSSEIRRNYMHPFGQVVMNFVVVWMHLSTRTIFLHFFL
jgi:hypothetical protein